MKLPAFLRGLFWDQEFDGLSWPRDRNAVTARILAEGGRETIRWLRDRMDDDRLRAWILDRRGRGLSARQLRYWQIVIDLPVDEVDAWLADPARRVWEERARR